MDEILVHDGRFTVPMMYELSLSKRTLKVRTPWSSQFSRLCKDDWTVSSQTFCRHKGTDKPYIPEGFIEIDDIMFKAVNNDG